MESGQADITAVFAGYDKDRFYTDEEKARFIQRAEEAAEMAAADVQDTGAAVEDVSVLPWHRAVGQAKRRFLAHSNVWQRHFGDGAQDFKKYDDRSTTAEISATFRVANRAFLRAVPPLALHDIEQRVNRVFAD